MLFRSPRLAATLSAMSVILGEREAAIARELTKLHEEVRRGRLAELAEYYGSAAPPKGEIVILIGPPEKSGARASVNADSLLRQALAHMPVSAAAALVADATGENRRTLYDRALALKGVK